MIRSFCLFLCIVALVSAQCDPRVPQRGGSVITINGGNFVGTRCDDMITIQEGNNTILSSTGGDIITWTIKSVGASNAVDTIIDFDEREDWLDLSQIPEAQNIEDIFILDWRETTLSGSSLPVAVLTLSNGQQLRLENYLLSELNEDILLTRPSREATPMPSPNPAPSASPSASGATPTPSRTRSQAFNYIPPSDESPTGGSPTTERPISDSTTGLSSAFFSFSTNSPDSSSGAAQVTATVGLALAIALILF